MTYSTQTITLTVNIEEKDNGSLGIKSATYVGGDGTDHDTITNQYTQPKGSATIPVKKEISGNAYDGDEKFKFTLAVGPAVDGSNQAISALPTIESSEINIKKAETGNFVISGYTVPGTYTYMLAEVAGNTAGMHYSTEARTIIVTVTGNGDTLSTNVMDGNVEITAGNPLVVTNKYGKITYTPYVNKVVNGENAPTETFNFKMKDTSSDRTGETLGADTATTTGAGRATFGEITYTKAGTYQYEITEVIPENKTPGMTYSTQTITLTVTVGVKGNGSLGIKSATYVGGDGTDKDTITNRYTQPKGSATIPVKKEISGNAYDGDEKFKFTLAVGGRG